MTVKNISTFTNTIHAKIIQLQNKKTTHYSFIQLKLQIEFISCLLDTYKMYPDKILTRFCFEPLSEA